MHIIHFHLKYESSWSRYKPTAKSGRQAGRLLSTCPRTSLVHALENRHRKPLRICAEVYVAIINLVIAAAGATAGGTAAQRSTPGAPTKESGPGIYMAFPLERVIDGRYWRGIRTHRPSYRLFFYIVRLKRWGSSY